MQLERLSDPLAVARRAADLVAETLAARTRAVLLLPAGATPVPLYDELVRRARAGHLDLAQARLVQLDELAGVAADDPRSFQAFFRRHLVGPLGLERNFLALDGRAPDPEEEIERHRRALAALGPADLVLLGLGSNGHLAFNEPGSTRSAGARLVELEAGTRAALGPHFPEGAPLRGLTLGLAEIAAGRALVLLVTGSSKAPGLARVLRGGPDVACPASLLTDHPGLRILADEPALAEAGEPAR